VRAVYSGRVASFDDQVGRGQIEAQGGLRFPFHCTAIADGTRTIAPDTPVNFRLVPGPLGALEATAIKTTSTNPGA
jgi:cold shock protein